MVHPSACCIGAWEQMIELFQAHLSDRARLKNYKEDEALELILMLLTWKKIQAMEAHGIRQTHPHRFTVPQKYKAR